MGAHLNGYTSREQTAYYIKALSKDMPKGRMASGRSLIWRLRMKQEHVLISCPPACFLTTEQGMKLWLSG